MKGKGWYNERPEHALAARGIKLGRTKNTRNIRFSKNVTAANLVDNIIAYEDGRMNDEEAIKLFQYLVDTGQAWKLQGHYGRTAAQLIEAGLVTAKGNKKFSYDDFIQKNKGNIVSDGHYHSIEVTDDDKMKLELGNWSDAGWHWDGDESDLVGFLIRVKNSKIKDEVLGDIKEKMNFDDFANAIRENAEKGDGLYELSGDNALWHFGQGREITEDDIQNVLEDLPDEEKEAFKDFFWREETINVADYDSFADKNTIELYSNAVGAAADRSDSWEDFFGELEDIKEDVTEAVWDYQDQDIEEGVGDVVEKWNDGRLERMKNKVEEADTPEERAKAEVNKEVMKLAAEEPGQPHLSKKKFSTTSNWSPEKQGMTKEQAEDYVTNEGIVLSKPKELSKVDRYDFMSKKEVKK